VLIGIQKEENPFFFTGNDTDLTGNDAGNCNLYPIVLKSYSIYNLAWCWIKDSFTMLICFFLWSLFKSPGGSADAVKRPKFASWPAGLVWLFRAV